MTDDLDSVRRRRETAVPRCAVCEMLMDPELARLEQWDCHPACDPTDPAARARARIRRKDDT